MKICTLASSSKGNSTIIFNDHCAVLIDMGISLRELEQKLKFLELSPADISAVLITHEHSDHTKGLTSLTKKYHTPILCHRNAVNAISKKLGNQKDHLKFFTDMPFKVGPFTVQAFYLSHDCDCCVGYNLYENDIKISYATDLGEMNDEILSHLFNSRLVILEANHDETLLLNNPKYSYPLKTRILSREGHLSNITTAKTIAHLATNNVRQVVLAHLSEENNTPILCFNTVSDYLASKGIEVGTHIKVAIAPARELGPVFVINK